jgi:hypothetical protein
MPKPNKPFDIDEAFAMMNNADNWVLWVNNRFVSDKYELCVLITGIQKYFDNQAELDAWCVQHNVMKQTLLCFVCAG